METKNHPFTTDPNRPDSKQCAICHRVEVHPVHGKRDRIITGTATPTKLG